MLTILITNYQVYLWHLGRPVPVPGVPLAPTLVILSHPGVWQSRPPTSHPLRPRGGAAAHQGPIQRDDRQLLEKVDIIKKPEKINLAMKYMKQGVLYLEPVS